MPRERLLDLLWLDSDLLAARNSLSVSLSSLRAQLEPPLTTPGASSIGGVLIADRSTISLHTDAFTTDVSAFVEALQAAKSAGESVDTLTHAVQQYTGELLPNFFEDWVLSERDRLAGLYQQALCRLVVRLIETGAATEALEYAQRAVQGEPLGEESHRLLMRVYAELGQPAAVHAQLQELERRRSEAGEAPPHPETHWLAQRLAENVAPSKIVSTATKCKN